MFLVRIDVAQTIQPAGHRLVTQLSRPSLESLTGRPCTGSRRRYPFPRWQGAAAPQYRRRPELPVMLLPRRRRGSKLSVEPSGNLTKLVRRCDYFVYLALLDALRGNHRRAATGGRRPAHHRTPRLGARTTSADNISRAQPGRHHCPSLSRSWTSSRSGTRRSGRRCRWGVVLIRRETWLPMFRRGTPPRCRRPASCWPMTFCGP